MTKDGSEHAFCLATELVQSRCSLDLVTEALVDLVCLSEEDAIRIADHALLCAIYHRLNAN